MHDDDNPPCLLYRCLQNTELFVTPHGFQSMLTMFLPAQSYMFEIFPSRYLWTGYKALGLAFGVGHVSVESRPLSTLARTLSASVTTERCMYSYLCRYLARKGDVSCDERVFDLMESVRNGSFDGVSYSQSTPWTVTPFSSCVASCERVPECFATRFTSTLCVQFRNDGLLAP